MSALVNALNDQDQYVKEGAAIALGKLKDRKAVEPLFQLLRSDSESMRRTAETALGTLGECATEPLLTMLHDPDWDVRWRATHILGEIKDLRAVEALIEVLKDENKYVIEGAITALGEIKDKRAVEPLTEALKDGNKYVREEATNALGEIKDERAIHALVDILADKDWGVRWGAANALGEIRHKSAIEPLIHAFSDEVRYVRESAAAALVRIGKSAGGQLIQALESPDPNVRRWSAWTLGKIKYEKATDHLALALQDEDGGVQFAAEVALTELEG